MNKQQFDIGLIVPLKEEFRYILEVASCRQTHQFEGSFLYELDFGDVTTVACVVGQMGPTPAQHSAHRLLSFADVKVLILLGLSGSLDSAVGIGDVVVASEVNEFQANAKAQTVDGGYEVRYSGRHYPLDFSIRETINHFEFSDSDLFEDWQNSTTNDYSELNIPQKELICTPPVAIRVGPLASGNTVAASVAFINELKAINRKFVAIDMEAAGVAIMATERINPIPLLTLRGISDSADENKKNLDEQNSGSWRRYAVRNAAFLLRNLLKWDVFLRSTGLQKECSKSNKENHAEELIRNLDECLGGKWLVGVAFDLYSHGPRVTTGQRVLPMDLSRLMIIDKNISSLIDSAQQLRQELMNGADIQQVAGAFAQAVTNYRNEVNSSALDALLNDFDYVVQETVLPAAEETLLDSIILEAERIDEQEGPESVVDFLLEHIDTNAVIREKCIDALSRLDRWQRILELTADIPAPDLSRSEIEHVIFAKFHTGATSELDSLWGYHKQAFNDRAATLFRREIVRQFPGFGGNT